MSRAEPIRRYLQSFSEELKEFVTESMTGMGEICHRVDVCGKRFREGLVRCAAAEFAEVEGSGLCS